MQLARSVKFRREKFGGVLFHTESEKVFTLNPTASCVVQEIRPGFDEAGLIAAVKARFRDPGERIGADVHALLAELKDKGLVTADQR